MSITLENKIIEENRELYWMEKIKGEKWRIRGNERLFRMAAEL